MSVNPMVQMPFLPTVERHFSRSETAVSLSVKGTTAQGTDVAIEKSREKNADGGVSISSSVKVGEVFSKTLERTMTAEQFDARQDRLHDLGVKLSENPVTGRGGRVHDGSLLINITA